jgi:pimeloyl-ACP methyl ester carboxylesterase
MPPPRAQSLSNLDTTVMPMALDSTMFAGWDTDALLRRIECPFTLEHGDNQHGSAIYAGELARAVELLRDVLVLHFEGTGHRPQLEARDRLLDALRRFIRERTYRQLKVRDARRGGSGPAPTVVIRRRVY